MSRLLLEYEQRENSSSCESSWAGAAKLRTTHQLAPQPGLNCVLPTGEHLWLHFVPRYKHLGVIYAADNGIQHELLHGIGQAAGAFATFARPVLCNRSLPLSTRLNLYRALVCTKLFYGLGCWPTLTLKQYDMLTHCMGRHLRRMLRLQYQAGTINTTDAQVLARAGFHLPRARHAIDRFLYSQKLFSSGPAFLRLMLQQEHCDRPDGWPHGLFADLRWMHEVCTATVPEAWLANLTDAFEYWAVPNNDWRVRVKKVAKHHLFQESAMHEIHDLHKQFSAPSSRMVPPLTRIRSGDSKQALEHRCFCSRFFSTPQGLALHKLKAHGIHAQEHHLLSGAACGHCLRYFWSTQRLYQHLSYIPRRSGRNPCYQALTKSGYAVDFEAVSAPSSVAGLPRVEALQAEGPRAQHVPLKLLQIQQDARNLEALMQEYRTLTAEPSEAVSVDAVCHTLTATTQQWFQDFCNAGHDQSGHPTLTDRWLAYLMDFPAPHHSWLELQFIDWGQKHLPDLIAQFVDGEAEPIADKAFAELLDDFPIYNLQCEISRVQIRLRALQAQGDEDVPHRPVRRGTANVQERNTTRQPVPRL